jgi:hypothetical protein
MALDSPRIGYVDTQAGNEIVIFGESNKIFDIPITKIQSTGRNVLIDLTNNDDEVGEKYQVKQNTLLSILPNINSLISSQQILYYI